MEFSQKLQELRKQKGVTQEELAEALYVSRTAVSKWESGRGTPNIESLKAISKYFSVSIDELLSGEAILLIADENLKQREKHFRNLIFGLLDCSMIMFFFLPLFAERGSELIKEVSLFSLSTVSPFIKTSYYVFIFGLIAAGILSLAFQDSEKFFWQKHKYQISVGLNAGALVCFMLTLQPYAAFFAFVFLAIKSLLLIKWR